MVMRVTEENNEPVLMLAGSYLTKNGFNVGDIVTVYFSDNKIVITKKTDEEAERFKRLAEKNPTLLKLSKEFDLDFLIA